MCEFIVYCFHCMGITISAAFGYNPSGLNLKTGIIGVTTSIVLIALLFCIGCLVSAMIRRTKE